MKYEGQQPGRVGIGKYFLDSSSNSGVRVQGAELESLKAYNLAIKKGLNPQFAFEKHLSDVSTGLKNAAQAANGAAIRYTEIGSEALVAASGLKGLKTAAGMAALEFGAMMKSFFLFYAVSEAINLLFKGLQKLWSMAPTQDHLLEWAAESAQQLEETQSNLENLNGELETTQDRIAELRNKGPLSLMEQEELDALEEANAKLERQKALMEALEKNQKQEASDDAYNALKGYAQVITRPDKTQKRVDIDEQIEIATTRYENAKANYASAKTDADKKEYAAQIKSANDEILDLVSKAEEQINHIDLSTASGEVKSFVMSTKTAINEGLLANGTLKADNLLGEVFNEDEFRNYGNKLNQLLGNKDFDFTETSLKEQLGVEFVDACEEAGISAEDLAERLQKLKDSGGKIEVKAPTLEDSIDEISNMESVMSALGDACSEFADNGGKVSIETIEGVAAAFDSMSDTKEFQNAIEVLSDSSSSVADVEAAMNDLANAYLNSKDVMRNLTDKNKELYISQLKQMGVSNAQEIVELKLAKAKLENASASEEEKNKAREQILAILQNTNALNSNAMAALTAAQQNEVLASYQSYIAGSNFSEVVKNHAETLYYFAIAAGTSALNLVKYIAAMQAIEGMKGEKLTNKSNMKYTYNRGKMAQYQNDAEKEYKELLKLDVDYTLPEIPTVPTSTETKKKPSEERRDKYNAAKEKLDDKLQKNQISYERYYKRLTALGKKYLKGQKGNAADYRQHLNDVIAARREVFSHAKEQLDQKYDQGIIGIRTYYKKTKALMDKWLKGRKSTEEDYANASIELSKKVMQSWNDRISNAKDYIDRRDLRQDWIPGQDAVSYLEKEMERLQDDYAAGLFGSTEDFLEVYDKLEDELVKARKDAAEAELDKIEKRVDSINDLTDMVSDMLKQRYEDMIDALEDQIDKYKEIVDQKKKALDITRDELSYQREMKKQGEELAKMQARAAVLALDNSREGKAKYAALMEEIRQKQEDISDKQADRAYDAKVKALDEASDAYEKAMQTKIDGLNEQMEHAGKWQEYVYSYIKNTNPSRLLEELKQYNYQYGSGLLTTVTDIWTECKPLLEGYKSDIAKILEAQKKAEKDQKEIIGDSDNPSANGMTKAEVKEAIKPKNTKESSDEKNTALVERLRDGKWNNGGDFWYDKKNKVIYTGKQGDRRVTAHTYTLINEMEEINNSKKTKAEKEKELKAKLKTLKTMWSYGKAHLEWDSKEKKFHLHKYGGTSSKWQIFHDGLSAGFVGSYVPTPKQNETYALLQKGELVLNRADQKRLGIQMQALAFLTEGLHRTGLSGVNSGTLGMRDIVVNVQAPVTIEGNADANTVKALRKYGDYISGQTLSKLQSAMNRRGYTSRVTTNAMKK